MSQDSSLSQKTPGSRSTSKVKARMCEAAKQTYDEVVAEATEISKVVVKKMEEQPEEYEFSALLGQWSIHYEDVKAAELQWSDYLSEEEVSQVESIFTENSAYFEDVKEHAEQYLKSYRESPISSPATIGLRELELQRKREEIARLQAEVKELEIQDAGERDSPSERERSSPEMPDPSSDTRQPCTPPSRPLPRYLTSPAAPPPSPFSSPMMAGHPQWMQPQFNGTYYPPRYDEGALYRLADVMSAQQRMDRLPRMEPDVFSGKDILKFPTWWHSFETLIEQEFPSGRDRLFLLARYTSDDAKDLVDVYMGKSDKEAAYIDARADIKLRFGDVVKIAQAYRDKIREWPTIRRGESIKLRKFSDFLWQVNVIKETMGFLDALDSADENVKLVAKLPHSAAERWNRIVVEHLYRLVENDKVSSVYGNFPPFVDFCKFVAKEARVADGPCLPQYHDRSDRSERHSREGKSSNQQRSDGKSGRSIALATGAQKSNNSSSKTPKCSFCEGKHWLKRCSKFFDQPSEFRKTHATDMKLCYGCLLPGHMWEDCTRRNNSLLRDRNTPGEDGGTDQPKDKAPEKSSTKPKEAQVMQTRTTASIDNKFSSMIVPVYVYSKSNPNVKTISYALLDSQSNTCFVQNSLVSRLNLDGRKLNLQLTTMGKKCCIVSREIDELCIQGIQESRCIEMPSSYTREYIPADRDTIPRPSMLRGWKHLECLQAKLLPYQSHVKVEILVGYNCSQAFLPREVRYGADIEPYGVQTGLGWVVLGPISPKGKSLVLCPMPSDNERKLPSLCFKTQGKEIQMDAVSKAFDQPFECGAGDESKWSYEDTLFMNVMKESMVFLTDGRVQLNLPVRPQPTNIPDNRGMALKRTNMLRSRMRKSEEFRSKYVEFIDKMIRCGHAELAPAIDSASRRWYLPHHGVFHPKKPGKLRVVFDGRAEYEGTSLNSMLMSGPDLGNTLLGVLCRFRMERVAFTCDVEAMFLQVKVPEEQRDLLRFFWFRDSDCNKELVEYRLTIHLFGATSSPSCAIFAFRAVAERYGATADEATIAFLKREFYVDDGLMSTGTSQEALRIITESHQVCERGGFNLCKYLCNDKEVMGKIPVDLRAKEAQLINLSEIDLPPQMTLGKTWDVEADCFRFNVELVSKPPTRRGMLSALGAIFDPLGLISPNLLLGRRMLQALCKQGHGWDDRLDDGFVAEWNSWYRQLADLSQLKIPKCYKRAVDDVREAELDIYCDASHTGYGACAYLTLRGYNNVKDSSLVLAKSRVPPTKAVTVPRLELQSAVLAVRMKDTVVKELPYKFTRINFWSDSMVVLGYIYNSEKKFLIYVSNRVQTIRETSDPHQWRHVPTDQNPADIASRGLDSNELMNSDLWWHGPDVDALLHVKEPEAYEVPESDPEVKRSARTCNTLVKSSPIMSRLSKVSEWRKMIVIVGWWRRYLTVLRSKIIKVPTPEHQALSVQELTEAEHLIAAQVQQESFADILESVGPREDIDDREARTSRRKFRRGDGVRKLDPYMDTAGLMRVGGRARKAMLPEALKHPVIMPKSHPAVEALIRYYHHRTGHSGRGITLNELRHSGWWVVHGRSAVDKVIRQCVPCRRYRGRPATQMMGDLPEERLQEAPPFTYTGVDFFGPFTIKERRSVVKRYACLFTCLSMRAVHIELCPDMTTDSFINAYRRFISRRGTVRVIKSDCGTNILGARTELAVKLTALDGNAIRARLAGDNCDWVHFDPNTPRAPHMGGVWERMIGTVKRTLSQLLHSQGEQLDNDSLQTLLAEVEAIVNHRPITYCDMSDPQHPASLTPMQLLTLKERVVYPPPGEFSREDMYSRRRWRRVQFLANSFWTRWRKEYVHTLQERQKWISPVPNLHPDDVVYVIEDGLSRNQWKLGRILTVSLSDDGLVRAVRVRTGSGEYDRPISRVVLAYREPVSNPINPALDSES